MAEVRQRAMQTIRTTETTRSSAKRVCTKIGVMQHTLLSGYRCSVCQFLNDPRDQTDHQRERSHEVRLAVRSLMIFLPKAREDDTKWPQKNKDGRQELEIRMGNEHVSFEVRVHCGDVNGRCLGLTN